MIALDANSTTTKTSTQFGKTSTITVDTLLVRYVELNLVEGSILAIIDRGQLVGDTFQTTDTSLWVDVKPDGSFSSRDGAWVGTVSTGPQILAGLKQAFDQFLLASGAVTGTQKV